MSHSLLETISNHSLSRIPYITMEHDVMYKLETALAVHKPLLLLFQSPFGHHQLSGFVTEIDPDEQWIRIKNGELEKQVMLDQILLVVEWN